MMLPSEFYLALGPIQVLRCGPVWALDIGRLRLMGVGLRDLRVMILRPGE